MVDDLLTTGFANDIQPGVFLYLPNEHRFVYIHYIERKDGQTEIYFAHTETERGTVYVDVFIVDDDSILDYFEPCKLNYN